MRRGGIHRPAVGPATATVGRAIVAGRLSRLGARVLVGIALLGGCAGAAPPAADGPSTTAPAAGATPAPSASTPADGLRTRAGQAAAHLTARRWTDYAGLAGASMRAACAPGELARLVALERVLLRALAGLADGEPLKIQVADVLASGASGQVTLQLVHAGRPVEGATERSEWTLEGGEWWLADESWIGACTEA